MWIGCLVTCSFVGRVYNSKVQRGHSFFFFFFGRLFWVRSWLWNTYIQLPLNWPYITLCISDELLPFVFLFYFFLVKCNLVQKACLDNNVTVWYGICLFFAFFFFFFFLCTVVNMASRYWMVPREIQILGWISFITEIGNFFSLLCSCQPFSQDWITEGWRWRG